MKEPRLAERALPMSRGELPGGENEVDFVYVTGDAYVDHPSFGAALICRILEHEGYTVGVIAQPDWKEAHADGDENSVRAFGRPRLAFLVSGGNVDSMVANYTVARRRRDEDYYSPRKEPGHRPDRAVIVYCNKIREAYGDVPIIIGGLEASLRRFAHYDYWDDAVRRSILVDSSADLISYGMGEKSIPAIASLLAKGVPLRKIRTVRGTAFLAENDYTPAFPYVDTGDYETIAFDKAAYAAAFRIQYENQDAVSGKAVTERYGDRILVQNPPMPMCTTEELDEVYALPFTRTWHPKYDECGGIAALAEVEFSITRSRGCFGACAFCAIAYNQGRNVESRSEESVLAEARLLTTLPRFKGYIHDIGGPTANFSHGPCKAVREGKKGVCNTRRCLSPRPCKNLIVDHSEYLDALRAVRALPGVKRVFVRSGVRFDYLMADRDRTFLDELVRHHVSGQLKVAPEHISPRVLNAMGKPEVGIYNAFCDAYFAATKKAGLEQYLVPYLMSSHPGSTLSDAVDLALYLKKNNVRPEQVQDFYPTPGTASTCMYHTGLDPFTGKDVYVPRDKEEKRLQRALLQYDKKENRPLVEKAIALAGREDAKVLLPGAKAAGTPQSGKKPPKGLHGTDKLHARRKLEREQKQKERRDEKRDEKRAEARAEARERQNAPKKNAGSRGGKTKKGR